MKNSQWIVVTIFAFFIGYITNFFTADRKSEKRSTNCAENLVSSNSQKSTLSINQKSSSTANLQTNENQQSASKNDAQDLELTTLSSCDSQTNSAKSNSSTISTEISDDEIDELLPKPFDASLKKLHGPLKEKYKAFSDIDRTKIDIWDIHMQGQLTDFVLSRPSATDIKIDSIKCNANMCEMRLVEQKKFLLLALFGELMQQSWIVNKVTGTADIQPDNGYGYILLMRKDD